MDDNNFDPGERFAATQGLRGAYDGEGFGTPGGDYSWVDDGYGVYRENKYSVDDLFSHFNFADHGLKPTDMWGGGMWNAERGAKPELAWLPGNKFLDNNNWSKGPDGNLQYLGSDNKPTDLKEFLTDLYGEDGISVYKTRDLTNPRKTQTVYRANGETIGQRDHKDSAGFFNTYAKNIAYGLGGAIAGAGIGTLAGTMGSTISPIVQAGGNAAFNTATSGGSLGDFGKSFLQNYLTQGANVGALGDFGEYTDLINKGVRGAAKGYLSGGSQGALLGAASPAINQGMSQLGDYFSNAFSGTDWEEMTGAGNGAMSMAPPQAGSFASMFSNQQGPMSTTASLQANGNGISGNQIDWDSVLQGQQGFGNTNPQEQESATSGYTPSAFGVGMDTAMPDPMQMASAPAAPQTGYDEYVKQMPDALKAVLVARYPQLRGVLGGGARMSPLAAGAGALATLYTANRARKDLEKQQGQLDSLFGQNSAYSKTMREQLNRKDAAAGRRSQYGPREVELQARLAQLNGQLAPQRFALANAQNQNRLGMYGSLLGYADQSGLTDQLGKSLKDLFS